MGVFLWLSDLHLDPFYGTHLAASHKTGNNCSLPDNATLLNHPYGRFGCDAPLSLLESALENAKKASRNADIKDISFVLVTGDFSRHAMDTLGINENGEEEESKRIDPVEYAGSIISDCISTIHTTLPNVPIIPVLGNNDVVPDYYLESNTVHHPVTNWDKPDPQTMLASVTNGLKDAFLSEEESSTFQHGGYFSRLVHLPPSISSSSSSSSSSSILVLSINTILYSTKHQPDFFDDNTDDDDPYGQFQWMESQLKMAAASGFVTTIDGKIANNQTNIVGIYLAGHIPPSIGSYRHSQMWYDRYLERFSDILKNYSRGRYNSPENRSSSSSSNTSIIPPPILGHFYGHVHTEEFRLLTYHDDNEILDESERNKTVTTEGNMTKTATTEPKNATETLVTPLLVTSSITPIYGSNPSYRLVNYDDRSGALLDYTTHYLDLDRSDEKATTKTPQEAFWIELPSFAEAYSLPDLSAESFENLIACLEGELYQLLGSESDGSKTSSSNLWETFWTRQHLYSAVSDGGYDDGDEEITMKMTHWLCIMGASSSEDYEKCLEKKQMEVLTGKTAFCGHSGFGDDDSSIPSLLGGGSTIFLVFIGSLTLGAVLLTVVLCVVWKKRITKRRMYKVASDVQDPDEETDPQILSSFDGDGVFVVEDIAPHDTETLPNHDGEMT